MPPEISSHVALCLFRIVQECLRNIARHSQARLARVSLEGGSSRIRLIVEDNGVGFDVGAPQGKAGLGLVSMRERLRLISGDICIRSSLSAGTRIEVFAPLTTGPDVEGLDSTRFSPAAI